MKQFIKFLTVFALTGILGTSVAFSQVTVIDSGTCGANLTWKLTSDSTLTISGSGAMDDYDYGYVQAASPWNDYQTAIKTIVIDSGVTTIGDWAFYNCSRLISIFIPNSVTTIGDCAFFNCSSLISIIIPNSVITIGGSAFYSCRNLISVSISNSVTTLGSGAFYNCSNLTSITIPNSITTIDISVFYGCSKLDSIIIPNSVTSIRNGAFQNCSSLTAITISNSVTEIGGFAFQNCSSLTSITIPNSVTDIGHFTFSNCSSLTSITIGNSVTTIGSSAFRNCSGLTSVTIPNSVTTIGYSTFYNCSSLKSITIPNSVTTINDYAFYNCSSLKSITIPNSVTTIGYSTFSNCCGLTSITIGNSVTTIDDYAFSNCSGLTSITSYAVPPVLGTDVFYNVPVYIPVYIPCWGYSAYLYTSGWGDYFTHFIDSLLDEIPTITKNGNVLTSSEAYSYQWYLDNEPIADATKQSYTYTQNGVYFVAVADEEGCFAKSDTISITNVGIVSITNYELRIFPNPTTGKLKIENGELKMGNVEIYDIYGRKQFSIFNFQFSIDEIDISHLSNGVYFIKINNKIIKVVKY